MGPGDYGRFRQRISRGPRGVASRAGLWSPTLRPVRGVPRGNRSPAVQEEGSAANPLLEDLRRMMRVLQRTVARGASRRAREAAAAVALEEESRARVESALGLLRSELLEMRFQNHQLARTLLDLNMKMQQLKMEHELEIASEAQALEDNAMNQELAI